MLIKFSNAIKLVREWLWENNYVYIEVDWEDIGGDYVSGEDWDVTRVFSARHMFFGICYKTEIEYDY